VAFQPASPGYVSEHLATANEKNAPSLPCAEGLVSRLTSRELRGRFGWLKPNSRRGEGWR
jgi:hypothetical protein